MVKNIADFVPAVDLVVRYCSKHRWSDILLFAPKFDDVDLNHDGVLDRHEVKMMMMTKLLGKEPPDFVVADMISSIDEDENGVIDTYENSAIYLPLRKETNDGEIQFLLRCSILAVILF